LKGIKEHPLDLFGKGDFYKTITESAMIKSRKF